MRGKSGVLVVDDSEEFLAAACSWIETQPGLALVGTSTNGAEAEEAVGRLAPDIVIMDAFMPVMDGFAATRAIKSRPAAPLIVLVSVHAGAAIEMEAWAAGADAFVVKTNLATHMLSILEGLCGGDKHRESGRATDAPRSTRETGTEP